MIKKYKLSNKPIGKIESAIHQIKLQEEKIKNILSYKIPLIIIPLVEEEIKKLKTLGIIRPSDSKYCFSAFPILKRNVKIPLVLDYKKLNKITMPTPYIFPTINDILMQLHNSAIFSKIDLNLGYYQIQTAEESIKYTAFSINNKRYEFMGMPFGLSNAICTFQRVMYSLLGNLKITKVYIDDILIHSESESQHLQHLEEVLNLMQINNISINYEKYEFFKKEVSFLAHTISVDGIKANLDRLKPLKNIKP
ncbi:Retrovirus-related Pol polyprotein from transposon gypsy [Dictyocoela muelleri]|nr:Retrovirus-related Pol polyprotein from transposon gypsy [Dictyocoela muelleri]